MMNYYSVNAFSKRNEGGNPAAVVVNQSLDHDQKQALAKKIGFSETAYINVNDGAISIEFFTPEKPIAYCGHATIASVSVLVDQALLSPGQYQLKTKLNPIAVNVEDGEVFMRQQFPSFQKADAAEAAFLINTDTSLVEHVVLADNGVRFLIIELTEASVLYSLNPNQDKIYQYSETHGLVGVYVFVKHNDKIISRMFAPFYGIPEENATGMAAGLLTGFLHKQSQGTIQELLIEQGYSVSMPARGFLKTMVRDDEGSKIVLVGGEATIVENLTI